jgi:hypothetical protein
VGSSDALEKKPDARTETGQNASSQTPAANNQPLPTNRDKDLAKMREMQAKKQAKLDKKKKKTQPAAAQSQAATPAATTPPQGVVTPPTPQPQP